MVPSIFRKRHEVEEIMPIPGELEGNSSGVDHLKHLAAFEKAHKLDPNLPIDELNDVDAALATGNAEKGIEIEHALMEDNSPYPEVGFNRRYPSFNSTTPSLRFGSHLRLYSQSLIVICGDCNTQRPRLNIPPPVFTNGCGLDC